LRLLSYNIFLRPPGIKNNISDYKNARLTHFGERVLKNYDVVCLQEMFAYGSSRQNKMIQYARKAGLEYYVSSPSKGLLNAMVDGGLLLMSRYPIVRSERMTYKRGMHSDRFSAKGAVYAKIAVSPTVHIHVFTTHMQSTYEANATLTDPSVVVRLNQIVSFKEFIDDCTRGKPAGEPILILGDMNVNARRTPGQGQDSEEYQLMMRILRGEITSAPVPAPLGVAPNPTAKPIAPVRFRVHDLALASYGEHPITFGDVVDFESRVPRETALTAPECLRSCGSIDHVLWLNSVDDADLNKDAKGIKVDIAGTKVQKFMVEGEPFSQLSGKLVCWRFLTWLFFCQFNLVC
ncbi:Endonuclease/exonuclease/phosphatase, partial [Blyttiomyces helicus]